MSASKYFCYNSNVKNDEKAQQYREIGNKHFLQKKWFGALWNYNGMIAFAKSKTVASFGYGNRSAVYFELGRFEDCMKNIEWAIENEYPTDKLPKLMNRKEKAERLIREIKLITIDPWNIFKLSYPANKNVPWVVDCVEVRRTEKDGRGIYAKQTLKAGDVICIEEPIFNYTDGKGLYMRCYNCAKGCALNLIPCDHSASMMFCSVPCKQNFYQKAFNLQKMQSADIEMLAEIAAVSKSVQNVDDIIKNMNLKELNKTIFDFDLSNPNDPQYKENLMTCLLSLSTNEDRVNDVCRIPKYVSDKTAQHILSIIKLNSKNSGFQFDNSTSDINGFHISLFASLINHSCYSNAFCINLDNKVFTIIHKPVRRGEQITIKYFDDTSKNDHSDVKQTQLLHKFKCECDLCAHSEFMAKMFFIGLQNNEYDIFNADPVIMAAKSGSEEVLKEFWERVWDDINRDSTWPKIYFSNYKNAFRFLNAAAAYLAYPFLTFK